jgi:hypothetical protein
VSIRTLAGAVGLSPTRVHQLVTGAELDVLDTALGELRAAGWPAPEDPDTSDDTELGVSLRKLSSSAGPAHFPSSEAYKLIYVICGRWALPRLQTLC